MTRRISDRIRALETKKTDEDARRSIFSREQTEAYHRVLAALRHALGAAPLWEASPEEEAFRQSRGLHKLYIETDCGEFESAVRAIVARLDAGLSTEQDRAVLNVGEPADLDLCGLSSAEELLRVYARIYQEF